MQQKWCISLWLLSVLLFNCSPNYCYCFQQEPPQHQTSTSTSAENIQLRSREISRILRKPSCNVAALNPIGLDWRVRGQDKTTTRLLAATEDENDGTFFNNVLGDERRKGIAVLMTVPFAWGTFEPVVRYVYAIDPPIPGLVFSPFYYFVAASTLSALSVLTSRNDAPEVLTVDDGINDEKVSSKLSILGGVELGFYLFLGNSLQVLGLNTLNSDRVAFLIQLTTIFVPLLQAIAARSVFTIPTRIWIASLVALSGVGVMGLEGKEDMLLQGNLQDIESGLSEFLSSQQFLSQGDILVILAALCYTFHCIRLEPIAKQTRAVTLAAMKATTETILSIALVIGLLVFGDTSGGVASASHSNFLAKFASESAHDITNFFAVMSQKLSEGSIPSSLLVPAIGACLWTGLITIGYTIYAQSYGQSRVNPSDANLIYTFQPVWTALIAFLLLGETLGPAGFIGGGLIGVAVYLVITSDQQQPSDEALGTPENANAIQSNPKEALLETPSNRR